jgi:cation diffusion facilitator family transporter
MTAVIVCYARNVLHRFLAWLGFRQGHDHSHGDHHDHEHGHAHHGHSRAHAHHAHTHGVVDPTISTSERGIWAIKWSFVILMITAALQVSVVWVSGSVALLADTIHNFADAATALPLWIAFALARWKPSRRFPYGYGRVEDLAGMVVVLIITFSAVAAGYQAVQRFLHPQEIDFLWAVAAASIVGFAGNEFAAVLRIKVGREINSAALVADGYHARIDGLTSLAVLVGAAGVWLGYPVADPIVGLLISLVIFQIVWQSSKAVFSRALDGVEPEIIDEIRHAAGQISGVQKVADVRARWLGHRLHADLSVAVSSGHSVAQGHAIAKEVRHRLMHQLAYLSSVMVHVDPAEEAGDDFHRISQHEHDGLGLHSH